MKKVLFKLIFVFVLTLPAIAQPDTLNLKGNEIGLNAIPNSMIFHSSAIQDVDEAVAHSLREGKKIQNPNVGFTKDIYWITLILRNISQQPIHEVIELENPQIDFVSLYKSKEGRFELITETGDHYAFIHRPIKVRNFVFPFDLKPNEVTSFVFKIDKRNSSLNFPISVWDAREYFEENGNANIGYGIYFGFIFLCGLYALLTCLFLKRAIYFWYFFWIVSSGLYAATSLGLSAQFLYPSAGNFNSFFRVIIEIVSLFAFLKFSQFFLRIPELFPVINKMVNGSTLFLVCSLVLVIIFQNQIETFGIILLPVFYLLLLFNFILIVFALWKSYATQRTTVLFYTLAFGTLIAASLMIVAMEFGVVTTININPYLVGSATELLVFSFAITYQIKNVFDQRNALALRMADQQKDLLKAYIEGVDLERSRISKELHDDIGSRLSSLQRLAGSNSETGSLQNELRDLHRDVRNLSHALSHHSLAATGLKQMLEELAFKARQGTSIEITIQDYDFPDDLPEDIQTNLYRIIQEGLENSITHAQATQVDIQLFKHDHEIIISIEDNGTGVDLLNVREGIGMKNMIARASQMNATLEFSGSKGNGFNLMVKVLLN